MKNITVITADVIGSKKYGKLQYNLMESLNKLKKHPAIIVPFSISRGDEIQGVLDGWLKAPEIIRNLKYTCRPMNLRIGIGFGSEEEENIRPSSWEMNGPAFYHARSALEELDRQKGYYSIIKSGISDFDNFINCIMLLVDTIQNKWTDKQWEAVQVYEEKGTYEEAAKFLNISMQNVEKRCKAANWKQLKRAETILAKTESYLKKFHHKDGEKVNFTF